jgi:hypothetical protein
MENRDTVGKLSWDLLSNSSPADHSADEQMREQLEDWDKIIYSTVEMERKCTMEIFIL